MLLAGRTQTTTPDSFGIIIFNAESDEAAQHIIDNDPALFPYKIALLSEEITSYI